MKAIVGVVGIVILMCASEVAHGTIRYVDISVHMSGDGESWETAFKTIQEGMDFASEGDTMIVARGTYLENIHFMGQNITLRSTDPLVPDVVQNTIIEGGGFGPVVTFTGMEGAECMLSGFTLRNGNAGDGGGICGGTREQHTHATIKNNIITANSGDTGGGVAACDGIVENNTIRGNSANSGGGGLALCHGSIRSNSIFGNSAGAPGEASGHGGGLAECNGIVINNTIVGNSATAGGGGLFQCDGTVQNCIVWGNAPDQIASSTATGSYSCNAGWTEGGPGNLSQNPLFVNPGDDDYHLSEGSPCIDSGKNEEWMWDAFDLDGNFRIFQGDRSWTVDMGAYEYGSSTFQVVACVSKKLTGGRAELTWSSRPGDTYTVRSCFSLCPESVWTVEATVPSGGITTTWADPDTTSARKYYRIGLK